jgi:hypothetical protein
MIDTKIELTDDMLNFWIDFCTKAGPDIGVSDAVSEMMAKELLELREKTRWIPVSNQENWFKDIVKMSSDFAELREKTRWIPVTEKLPDDDIECLVCDDCGIYMAIMDEGDWWMDGHKLDGITHWMPLPEMPE